MLVREVPAADQGDPAFEPCVGVLPHEAQRVVPGAGGVDGVHVALEPRDVRREVRGAERRPELLHDLTARLLEGPLKGAAALMAEGPVLADHRDLPVLQRLVHPPAERVSGLASRPAGGDDIRAPPALGQVFSGDGGGQRRDLLALDV